MGKGFSVVVNIGATLASSLDATIGKAEAKFANLGKSVERAQQANLAKRAEYRSQIADVAALGASLYGLIKPAIDFESAMADVRKVVEFETPQQFKQMGRDVVAMSQRLPMAADGLASIVAAAGQSGIAKNELLGFTEAAAKMGIAFDISADVAGETMAKWRTAMKLTQPQVESLADAVNELSNKSASSAADIADVLRRQGSVALTAGLTATQTAALASSILSAGASSEVAATGLKNFALALSMGEALSKSQKAALSDLGLEAKDLASGMQRDAEGTIFTVLRAIKAAPEELQAGLMETIFGRESLGAIAPLLTNLDALKDSFALVGDEANYLGSATKEFEARSATTANSIQLFQNRVSALAITVGSVLLPGINSFLGVIGPVVTRVADLADRFPVATKVIAGAMVALISFKIAAIATGYAGTFLKGGLLDLQRGMLAVGRGALMLLNPLGLVRSAITGLKVALLSSGIGAIVLGLALGGMWIANNWENLSAMFDAFGASFMDALGPARPAIEGLVDGVSSLVGWMGDLVGPVQGAEGAFVSFGATVGTILGGVIAWFFNLPGRIVDAITSAAENVKAAFGRGIVDGMLSLLWNFHPGALILRGLNEIVATLTGFNLFESGQKLIGTLVDGVKAKAGELVAAVKGTLSEVRQYLPFSDAKVGPLSELTRSGAAIPATIGEGVAKAGASPVAAPLAGALAGVLAVSPATAAGIPSPASLAASSGYVASAPAAPAVAPSITIHVNGNADADAIADKVRQVLAEVIAEAEASRRAALHD